MNKEILKYFFIQPPKNIEYGWYGVGTCVICNKRNTIHIYDTKELKYWNIVHEYMLMTSVDEVYVCSCHETIKLKQINNVVIDNIGVIKAAIIRENDILFLYSNTITLPLDTNFYCKGCNKYKKNTCKEHYQCSCKQDVSCLFNKLIFVKFFIKQFLLIIDVQNYLYRWVSLVY